MSLFSLGGINDFGARYYDKTVGRWWGVDAKSEKWNFISPFPYVNNNPIIHRDMDGRDITPAKGSSKEFLGQYKAAKQFLKAHKADKILANIENNHSYNIVIKEYTGNMGSHFDSRTNTINWNPKQGLLTTKGKMLSATTVLNHELDHANQFNTNPEQAKKDKKTPDPNYGNNEEKRVITGSEQETARKLNEINANETTREDHSGQLYPSTSSISTEWADVVTVKAKRLTEPTKEASKNKKNNE